jgi:hypothetical protein
MVPLLALAIAALACSFDTGSDGGSKEPTAEPVVEETEEPAEEGDALVIDNQSGVTICGLYVTTPDDDTWGDNQLDSGEEIASGDTFRLFNIDEPQIDARTEDCDENLVGELYSIDLIQGDDVTWSVSEPSESGESSLTVYNKTGQDFCYLYIRVAGDSEWGDNQVEDGEKISNLSTYEISGIPEGTYDIRGESCATGDDYLEADRTDVDLTDDFQWTLTPPD